MDSLLSSPVPRCSSLTEGDVVTASDSNPETILEERTQQLTLLRDVAVMANETESVEDAIRYCLRVVSEHNGWCFGHALLVEEDDPAQLVSTHAWYEASNRSFAAFRDATAGSRLRTGDGLPGKVLQDGKPYWTTNLESELNRRRAQAARKLGLETGFAFPILVGADTVGVLEFYSDEKIDVSDEQLSPMGSVGAILGRVVERSHLSRQLSELSRIEQEQVYSDLHDSIGQQIAAAAMEAESLARKLSRSGSEEADAAWAIPALLRKTIGDIRLTARAMLRLSAESGGLETALRAFRRSLLDHYEVGCVIRYDPRFNGLHPDRATHCYRIIQEAVSNALRHGHAKQIRIDALARGPWRTLKIRDDGIGLPAAFERPGIGIRTMRWRARILGGTLTVHNGETGGAVVECRFPESRAKGDQIEDE